MSVRSGIIGGMTPTVYASTASELDPITFYGLLRLREEVFVVEQDCAYHELDGRDVEPTTLHLWCADPVDGSPVATVRVLLDPLPDGETRHRIGRACVRPELRGTGLMRALLDRAVAYIADRPSVLDAQAHLAGLYSRWGYVPDGPEFVEDGIPHVPMRRDPARRPGPTRRSTAERA
ncbi:GNAT family N-acetyltransferase [Gordonia cholesterolivorans]|uniref:N-acetyltransferase domain-containing protein n=3 Tax=Gordoniaceae TaxID=85026 RepID=L7LH56_9ACTN|nr:hypothetical protein GSI01S_07_00020 [Gordonia sihwensis NBRC 108236]